jgi:hypothetical protein
MMYCKCTVASKSKKQKNLIIFSCHLEGHRRKCQDPLIRGTDPRIRIRTNMSRIRNTCLGDTVEQDTIEITIKGPAVQD